MARLAILLILVLGACRPDFPDFDRNLTDESRAADYPPLVPLDPLLASIETEAPRVAADEGESLEARAAALRARAAWLQSLQL